MTLTFDTRARLLLLVLLFVLAASVAGFMAFQRLHGSEDDSPSVTPSLPTPRPHVAPAKHAPAAKLRAGATRRHATAAAAPRHATATVAKPAAKVVPPKTPNELPLAIQKALARNRVVVVALYDPNAKIDGSALAEARAGARIGRGVFVPIDVRRHSVDPLNARYGAVHDPSVLVLRPREGSLVVRIDGFADRDTVAQAALNAAS